MAANRLSLAGSAFVAILALGGCNGSDLRASAGHYEGFRVSGGPAGPTQNSIGGDLTIAASGQLHVTIQTEPVTGDPISFEAVISGQSLTLSSTSPGVLSKSLVLQAGASGCYTDSASDQLCISGTELKVLLTEGPGSTTKYVLDRMNVAPPAQPATSPRPYAIADLMTMAQNRSFTALVEFQSVIQQKLTAREAYLNLLPHINIGSGLDLVGFVPLTMVRAIGDILPFFLPSRWFAAAADNDAALAEFDSYRVIQADAMNIVQGLALSVLRDEQALLSMQTNRLLIQQVRDEILLSEHNGAGNVQMGSSDDISAILTTLVAAIDAMEDTISQEKTALSQAAGFVDPRSVSGVLPITVTPVTGPIAGAPKDFENAAVNRSIALLQIDDLAEAAKKTKDAGYFQWLDPTGNDQESLGFGLVDSIKVNSSLIQQLYVRKTSTQATLLETIDNTLTSSGQIADEYQVAVNGSQTAQNNVARLLLDFRTGLQFEMSELVTALQTRTQDEIAEVNAQYAYLILQAQMDFQTYSGAYAPLLAEKWTGPGSSSPLPKP